MITACDSDFALVESSELSIKLVGTGSYIGKAGVTFTFTVDVSSSVILKNLETYKDGVAIGQTIDIEPVTSKTIQIDYTPTYEEAGRTLEFIFIVIDEQATFTSIDAALYVEPTYFGFERNDITLGQFHNNSIATYNLVENTIGDSIFADMWFGSPSGLWEQGWQSMTDTKFVYLSGASSLYQSLTLEEAILYYESGSPETNMYYLSEGDVVIAKLRGKEEYAVISVTNVDPPNGTNTETLSFSYKKFSEFSGR